MSLSRADPVPPLRTPAGAVAGRDPPALMLGGAAAFSAYFAMYRTLRRQLRRDPMTRNKALAIKRWL